MLGTSSSTAAAAAAAETAAAVDVDSNPPLPRLEGQEAEEKELVLDRAGGAMDAEAVGVDGEEDELAGAAAAEVDETLWWPMY